VVAKSLIVSKVLDFDDGEEKSDGDSSHLSHAVAVAGVSEIEGILVTLKHSSPFCSQPECGGSAVVRSR
jgi:hypothetical protein